MSEEETGADYREPMFYEHVKVTPARRHEHPNTDRVHPPLSCPAPRIQEPLRGYRCPACTRRIRFEGYEWDAQEAADQVLSALGEAARQCVKLARELPRWAEVAVGLVFLAGPMMAWIFAQGWLAWR